jgi:hypothetical protein
MLFIAKLYFFYRLNTAANWLGTAKRSEPMRFFPVKLFPIFPNLAAAVPGQDCAA